MRVRRLICNIVAESGLKQMFVDHNSICRNTETCLCNMQRFLKAVKNDQFQMKKKYFSHFFLKTYVLTSTNTLCFRAKMYTHACKPQFYHTIVGWKGVYISRTCKHDEQLLRYMSFSLRYTKLSVGQRFDKTWHRGCRPAQTVHSQRLHEGLL